MLGRSRAVLSPGVATSTGCAGQDRLKTLAVCPQHCWMVPVTVVCGSGALALAAAVATGDLLGASGPLLEMVGDG
jgi:hypothetical protein